MPINIFKRPEVFDTSHVPEVFRHREPEMKELASCISPLMHGMEGGHALVHGEPATGKTTSIRKLFEELDGQVEGEVEHAYVNASLKPSAYGVLSEIFLELSSQRDPPDKSAGVQKLTEKVLHRLGARGKPLVLCLDEFDHMPEKELRTVLAPLLKPSEFSTMARGCRVSLILVTTGGRSPRIGSSLQSLLTPVRIRYRQYSSEEMTEILETRAESGFGPGVAKGGALETLADSGLDLRQCIKALGLAGECADRRGSRVVTRSDALDALNRIGKNYTALDSRELKLVRHIARRGRATSGEVYDYAEKELGIKGTKAYHLLKALERRGVVESAPAGGRGNSRLFTAKVEVAL